MKLKRWTRLCVALAAAAVAGMAPAWCASGSATSVSGDVLDDFARPHMMVDIGEGRRLNLFCSGSGDKTVLFDAGGSDWSVIWGLVQPKVAERARACSYDRAGLGYSDAASGPRSPVAIVEDLHALIHAAGLRTPLVLVGHSLGGFNVKLYAALYPEDVAGLVLVDPSEERSAERIRDRLGHQFGHNVAARLELFDGDSLERLTSQYRDCAETARSKEFDPASVSYRRCSDPVRPALGPVIAAERSRLQVTLKYQEAQASEISNSVYGQQRADAVYARLFVPGRFGTKPMLVLTHGNYDASDPLEVASYQSYLLLHSETASLSRRGHQRAIPHTSHNIEIDAPDAVKDAVLEVLGAIGR